MGSWGRDWRSAKEEYKLSPIGMCTVCILLLLGKCSLIVSDDQFWGISAHFLGGKWSLFGLSRVFSCPEQLNRWPCHSLTKSLTKGTFPFNNFAWSWPEHTGCFFWLVLPRKVLSMELVPPNIEKWLSSLKIAIYLPKKVKVQVRACQTLIFLLTYSKKWRSDRLWHGLSLF